MNNLPKIFGKHLRNLIIFNQFKEIGFDYLLNPTTGELHNVNSDFLDSHNLHIADLNDFIGLTNIGIFKIHKFEDGTLTPIYDLITGEFIDEYKLNKCKHCSWE